MATASHETEGAPRRRRGVALLAWTMTLLVPAGVAMAMWSASGTGDGAAKARTATALTVSAGTAVADLYPGATGNVRFSVNNPNPYPVTLTAGSATSISSVTGGAGACAASDFTVSGGTISSTTVTAGGSASVVLAGAITMKPTAGDGCQGADIAVAATLTGSQS